MLGGAFDTACDARDRFHGDREIFSSLHDCEAPRVLAQHDVIFAEDGEKPSTFGTSGHRNHLRPDPGR